MARKEKVITKDLNMKSGDFILVLTMLALVIFGIIMVFSASYYYSINEYGDPYYYLKRDIVWAVTGLILMLIAAVLNYRSQRCTSPFAFYTSWGDEKQCHEMDWSRSFYYHAWGNSEDMCDNFCCMVFLKIS